MSINIGIIGAGWYGCHIGATLKNLGFQVQIFEKNPTILSAASGNNQFRLHMGFHYARHYATRVQSRDGFMRFIERYPNLSLPIDENIYAVPKHDSLIDFLTYKSIMTASGIDYKEINHSSVDIINIEGMINTCERVVLLEKSRSYFMSTLKESLNLETKIENICNIRDGVNINGEFFDFAIDATWGHLFNNNYKVFYEPTILLYYHANIKNHPAVTFVDGPLCSVYPTEDELIYTLSSVEYTPLGTFNNSYEAAKCLSEVDNSLIMMRKKLMEEQIEHYLPNFRDNFNFLGPQLSIKTKPIGRFDDRSCSIIRNDNIFSVQSGKIDNIFYAVERILSLWESKVAINDFSVTSKIYESIGQREHFL